MKKIKIEIKHWFTGSLLFEWESENNSVKETLLKAVESGADLSGADLRSANLRGADLRSADLSGADLRGADLTPIKNDLFIVLLYSIPEIQFLKKNIIEGKIDGSTYDGACACLSGTLANGAKQHHGPKQGEVIKSIMSCRDANRPIERFFLGIGKGDTPENNQFAKLALEWIEEFEALINFSN